jgi:hypothetical protein
VGALSEELIHSGFRKNTGNKMIQIIQSGGKILRNLFFKNNKGEIFLLYVICTIIKPLIIKNISIPMVK